MPWPQAALNLLSLSLYPATLPLYHCCIWTDLVFLRRLSVKQTLEIFFSKIWIFSPMFIFWLYFESTGDYCKHYRHYNNFLLYCISEIFWYKYNFASRAVNNSLEKPRSMFILLKNVLINIYYNEKKLIISWSNQNSDCEVYSGFFKSLCVISYYWTLSRATMLPAKLSPPPSLFCSGNIFFAKKRWNYIKIPSVPVLVEM